MAEVDAESAQVPSTKARTAVFIAAMRHFRGALLDRQVAVHYSEVTAPDNTHTLAGELTRSVKRTSPDRAHFDRTGRLSGVASFEADRGPPGYHLWRSARPLFLRLTGRVPQPCEPGASSCAWNTSIGPCAFNTACCSPKATEPEGGQWNFDTDNRRTLCPQRAGHFAAPAGFSAGHNHRGGDCPGEAALREAVRRSRCTSIGP